EGPAGGPRGGLDEEPGLRREPSRGGGAPFPAQCGQAETSMLRKLGYERAPAEERRPAGDAVAPGAEDPGREPAAARLRHHLAHPARLRGPAPGGGGVALSRAAPHGAAGPPAVGVGGDRQEPRGPLLLADREGAPAARAGGGELEPPDRRRGAGTAVRLRSGSMSWLTRLSNTVRSGRVEREIRRELEFHVAERAD